MKTHLLLPVLLITFLSTAIFAQDAVQFQKAGVGNQPVDADSGSFTLPGVRFRPMGGFTTWLSGTDLLNHYAVRGIEQYAALQPGVIQQDNLISMFGGQYYQTGYYLNGINVNSVTTRKNGIYIIPEALESLTVGSLPFDAQFGGATGGMIDARMRTGGENLRAAVFHRTDAFASEGKQFLGTYSYGNQSTVALLSGPLFTPRIRFFMAGEFNPIRDRARRYVEGFTQNDLILMDQGGNPLDTLSIDYPGGNTRQNKQERWAFNSNLVFDFKPLTGRVDFTYLKNRDQLNETPILAFYNGRKAYDVEHNYFLNASLDYSFLKAGRANVRYSTYNDFIEREDDLLGSNYLAWYDSSANAARGVQFPGRYTAPSGYIINGMPFQAAGAPYQDIYFKSKAQFREISANVSYNISSLLNPVIGMTDRKYTKRYYSIDPTVISLFTNYPQATTPQDISWLEWMRYGKVSNSGYDEYGAEYSGDEPGGPSTPRSTAWYIQNQADIFGILHLDAGLRYETVKKGEWTLKDPTNPIIDSQTGFVLPENFVKAPGKKRILPRLNMTLQPLSFIRLNGGYGKYLQVIPNLGIEMMPMLTHISTFYSTSSNPIESVQIEMGAAFQHNNMGQLNLQYMLRSDNTAGDDYPVKGNIFGVMINSPRYFGFQANLNYTYTNSELKVDNDYFDDDNLFKLQTVQKHRGSVLLDYYHDNNSSDGIWNKIGAAITYRYNSGHYYYKLATAPPGQMNPYLAGLNVYLDSRAAYLTGTDLTPWNNSFDLKIYKFFSLSGRFELRFSLNVINLFNHKNVINVYALSGSAADDGFIHNPQLSGHIVQAYGGDSFVQLYENMNLKNGEAYRDPHQGLGKDLWGTPRQILLSLALSFR